jgi:hypothetical protein
LTHFPKFFDVDHGFTGQHFRSLPARIDSAAQPSLVRQQALANGGRVIDVKANESQGPVGQKTVGELLANVNQLQRQNLDRGAQRFALPSNGSPALVVAKSTTNQLSEPSFFIGQSQTYKDKAVQSATARLSIPKIDAAAARLNTLLQTSPIRTTEDVRAFGQALASELDGFGNGDRLIDQALSAKQLLNRIGTTQNVTEKGGEFFEIWNEQVDIAVGLGSRLSALEERVDGALPGWKARGPSGVVVFDVDDTVSATSLRGYGGGHTVSDNFRFLDDELDDFQRERRTQISKSDYEQIPPIPEILTIVKKLDSANIKYRYLTDTNSNDPQTSNAVKEARLRQIGAFGPNATGIETIVPFHNQTKAQVFDRIRDVEKLEILATFGDSDKDHIAGGKTERRDFNKFDSREFKVPDLESQF